MKKVNIAALGDSLTKGVVLNSENKYSILKGSFIDIVADKLNLCIKNYAKFGCTIGFGHNVIDRHSSDISASDITFLEFGGNDCDFDWKMIADDPASEHTPKTILDSFKNQFLLLVERVRELGSKPVILSLPPIDSDAYFSFISRFMNDEQKANVVKWLGGDINIITRWHETYNRALFEISASTNTLIIDITTPFENYNGDIMSLMCSDGIHPNPQGHKLIANSIMGVSGVFC
ncbi:MAG: SGNH/GDSL hydrolase family protein [Bacteroidaceae bacterium]|nr:SGNH/GDSL hydrolase family protein [Bacteroidaceae bacterium]